MFSEELRRDLVNLGVEVDGSSPEGLRDAVIARLASLHPDKTGGQFRDEEQENSFRKVKGFLERLDSETSISSQLIPINHVVTLVDILSKLQASNSRGPELKQIEVSDRYKTYLKRKYALPKITSAIVAALCFALFSLLGNFRQNPLYRSAVDLYAQDSSANILKGTRKSAKNLAAWWLDLDYRTRFAKREISIFQRTGSTRDPEYYVSGMHTAQDDYSRLADRRNQETMTGEIDSLIERNLTDINLFESTEPDFLFELKANSAQLAKDLTSTVATLNSLNPKNTSAQDYKASLGTFLNEIQKSLTGFDSDIKASESQLTKQKTKAINQADGRILRRLALLTISACLAFVLLWMRERSDERWVEFLSSEQGVELVLTRLSANSNIMTREPPAFSLGEFTEIVRTKDVPAMLSPIVGNRLDVKQLGQISGFLLDKLKNKKVISERTTSALQTWFDVNVDQDAASREQAS
jgi:hypothetical protein